VNQPTAATALKAARQGSVRRASGFVLVGNTNKDLVRTGGVFHAQAGTNSVILIVMPIRIKEQLGFTPAAAQKNRSGYGGFPQDVL
jgi:hypothetical protein